ncbi:hypothetical protein Tco_0233258 [Tanacetum coccineum]
MTFPMMRVRRIDGETKKIPEENLRKNPKKNQNQILGMGITAYMWSSSDSYRLDTEIEDEEADIAPGPTNGTATQRLFAIRDFPRGMYEVGESSVARDSSSVGGLEPWALRRDLETTRTQARLIEAERKLEEIETRLAWARMKRDTAERSLHESHGWNRRFMGRMDHARQNLCPIAARNARELIRGTKNTTSMNEFKTNMNHGAGGVGVGVMDPCAWSRWLMSLWCWRAGTEGAVGLCQWFEKLESVFRISDCREKDKVKFATAALQGLALTCGMEELASKG